MRLSSDSFTDGGLLPAECAFVRFDAGQGIRLSSNRNPHLAWDDVPSAAHSLVLFCRDIDAPADVARVHRSDQPLPVSLPRSEFFHWILADIPVALPALEEGQLAELVVPHGKPGPRLPLPIKNGTEHQLRQGLNDFTLSLAGDPAMAGEYFGYDGPFPPWNDERAHTYVFTLYALDTPRLPLEGRFSGRQARQALQGHILDEAQIFCMYSLNPHVLATF